MKLTEISAFVAAVLPVFLGTSRAAPSVEASPDSAERRDGVTAARLGGRSFRIQQVPNTGFVGGKSRGPLALARAFNKWNQPYPDTLVDALDNALLQLGVIVPGQTTRPLRPGRPDGSRPGRPVEPGMGRPIDGIGDAALVAVDAAAASGEVVAVPAMFDSQYLCEVQIGTPLQTLTLNIDTGSSDFWVFSSETPRQYVNGHTVYNIPASSTSKIIPGAKWSILYGDGSNSAGNVYTDVVSIAGITVQTQAIESATRVSASFMRNGNQDGLVGLAFGKINTVTPNKQKTFFENAMESLAMPVFTANLKKGKAGNYNFGLIDQTEFTGNITYTKVNSTIGHWLFEVESFQVGGVDSGTGRHTAVADTGTTLMLLPSKLVRAYYSKIPSARLDNYVGGYTFRCTENIPDFTAIIGGFKAKVPGDFIKFAPVETNDIKTSRTCFGGIQSNNDQMPFAIYGDVFLKAFFVVFNQATNQLGLADKPL